MANLNSFLFPLPLFNKSWKFLPFFIDFHKNINFETIINELNIKPITKKNYINLELNKFQTLYNVCQTKIITVLKKKVFKKFI